MKQPLPILPYSKILMRLTVSLLRVTLLFALVACDSNSGQPENAEDSPLGKILKDLDRQAVAGTAEAPPTQKSAPRAKFPYDNWYPDDISPPEGTVYPCALTALPRNLSGIPDADRKFINHMYAILLQAVHSKLVVTRDIGTAQEKESYAQFKNKFLKISNLLRSQRAPNVRMTDFKNAILKALDLQIIFFEKVIAMTGEPSVTKRFKRVPEGRESSNLLKHAWTVTLQQYPELSGPLKDSMFHHLCALDIF